MTQNATLIFDCLFLHDTQMTDLEREQTALRRLYSALTGNKPADTPFNFAPPFCSLPENEELSGKLTIEASVARAGWIVRPVMGQTATGDSQTRGIPVQIPGYPQIPDAPCFILGYAGDLAESLLERVAASNEAAAVSGPSHATVGWPAAFSVSARYRAALTLEVGTESGGAFSCVWTVGPKRWEKA